MSIQLPADLADVAAAAGVRWPEADETAMSSCAAAWRDAGRQLSTLSSDADADARSALGMWEGDAADAARRTWDGYVREDGRLPAAIRECTAAADRLEHGAEQVAKAKREIIRQLVELKQRQGAAWHAQSSGFINPMAAVNTEVAGMRSRVAQVQTQLTQDIVLDNSAATSQQPRLSQSGPTGDGAALTMSGTVTSPGQASAVLDGTVSGGQPAMAGTVSGANPTSSVYAVHGTSDGQVMTGTVSPGGNPAEALYTVDPERTGPVPAGVASGDFGPRGSTDVTYTGLPQPPGPGATYPTTNTANPQVAPDGPAQVHQALAGSPTYAGTNPGPGATPLITNQGAGGGLAVGGSPPGGAATAGPPGGFVGAGPVSGSGGSFLAGPGGPSGPGGPGGTAAGPGGIAASRGGLPLPGAVPPPLGTPGGHGAAPGTPLPGGGSGALAGGGPGSGGPSAGSSGGGRLGPNPLVGFGGPGPAPAQPGVPAPGPGAHGGSAGPTQPSSVSASSVSGSTATGGSFTAGPGNPVDRAAPPDQTSNQTDPLAMFMLFLFPPDHPVVPAQCPARQVAPPPVELDLAAGLRFPPGDHPQATLIDHSPALAHPPGEPLRLSDGLPAGHNQVRALTTGHDPLGDQHERDWDRRFLVRDANPEYGMHAEYAWPPCEAYPEGGCSPEAVEPTVLNPGAVLDRFGGPAGRVLALDATPFSQRSLPPEYQDHGYHRYLIERPIPVWRTVSAAWFGQPGGGVRYRPTHPVADLIALGYLTDVTRTEI